MRRLVILIAAGILPACTGMMLGGGATGSSAVEKDRTSVATQTSDTVLSDRVRAQYSADPMLAKSGITVRASDGMVTLAGKVSTYAARETAEKLAIATHGVKGVDNQITVNYEK